MIFLLLFVTQVFVILALIAGVFAAPQGNPNDITILKQEENNNIGVSGYHFSYEQSDGQKREETAELKNEGTDDEFLTIVGSFSFVAPDGHTYRYARSLRNHLRRPKLDRILFIFLYSVCFYISVCTLILLKLKILSRC